MIALRNNENLQSQEVFEWLENYNGTFEFLISLKVQLTTKGYLSDKQISAAERCMQRDKQPKLEVVKPKPTFSVKAGQVLEVRKGFAKKMAQLNNSPVAFHNFEVNEVKAETSKAILVRIKASSKVTSHCCVCGRTLTDPTSVISGIGPDCAEKSGIPYGAVEMTKEAMEQIAMKEVECESWIPKSALKNLQDLKNNT